MADKRIIREERISVHGLDIIVQYKLMKNISVRIKPDNNIYMSVPFQITDKQLNSFLSQQEGWIRSKLEGRRKQPKRYVMGEIPFDGEHLWLWGERIACRFVVEKQAAYSYKLTVDGLCFSVPEAMDAAARLALVEAWLKYKVREEGSKLLNLWQEKMGVHYTGLNVHKMKTRWGSCNVRSGRINLNALLACWPKACLELIVVHELTHLLEAPHSARFHALMTRFLPDWKRREQLIEKFEPL